MKKNNDTNIEKNRNNKRKIKNGKTHSKKERKLTPKTTNVQNKTKMKQK